MWSNIKYWIISSSFDEVSSCYIARYTDVWNRLRESEIHDIHEIGSGTKLLFTFLSLKVFRHEERETHSFYADCFYIISSQPNQRAAPVAHKVVWPRRAPKVFFFFFWGGNSTHWLFSNPKNPQPTLPVHDVTHIPWFQFLSGIFILTSLNDTSLGARVNTCVNVAPN